MDAPHCQFFQNRECEFFPCHPGADPEGFNCLFCYCPLYPLGRGCGGSFRYTKSGVKDCSGCMIPHKMENYDKIMEKLQQVCDMAAESFSVFRTE